MTKSIDQLFTRFFDQNTSTHEQNIKTWENEEIKSDPNPQPTTEDGTSLNRSLHTPEYIQGQLKLHRDNLNEHLQTKDEQYDQFKTDYENGNTPYNLPEDYKWQTDPEMKEPANILMDEKNNKEIAQIQIANEIRPIDSETPNTQLFFYDHEGSQWQDEGVHRYDDAVSEAEQHAIEVENSIDNDPEMDMN